MERKPIDIQVKERLESLKNKQEKIDRLINYIRKMHSTQLMRANWEHLLKNQKNINLLFDDIISLLEIRCISCGNELIEWKHEMLDLAGQHYSKIRLICPKCNADFFDV